MRKRSASAAPALREIKVAPLPSLLVGVGYSLKLGGNPADTTLVDVTFKLWHLLVATVLTALAAGLMLGRYALPVTRTYDTNVVASSSAADAARTFSNAVQAGYREQANQSEAKANLRAAIPAAEAYYVDSGRGYAGMEIATLKAYDSGYPPVTIVRATRSSYCIESTVGSANYHKDGPGADVASGPCP
jgi:hypothetical protein